MSVKTARTANQLAYDALDELAVCKETLQQLEALLWTIKISSSTPTREQRIAAMGAFVANDRSSALDGSISVMWKEFDALGGAV
jgi:hypothetical protein